MIQALADKIDQILNKMGNGVDEKSVENLVEKKTVGNYFNDWKEIEKSKLNWCYTEFRVHDRDVARQIQYNNDRAGTVLTMLKEESWIVWVLF